MKHAAVLLLSLLFALPASAGDKDRARRLTFLYGGRSRTYYCLIPSRAAPDAPLPVVVLLHGSGLNGSEMTGAWRGIASRDGFMLVAPNSLDSAVWNLENDSPAFLHAAVAQAAAQHPIDPRRVYLFGNSGGASYALVLALIDSDYFAAVGAHAGLLDPANNPLFADARRKVPIALWVGNLDPGLPVSTVTATRDDFAAHGFPVQLTIIPDHGHFYGQVSEQVNRAAWAFFSKTRLPRASPVNP